MGFFKDMRLIGEVYKHLNEIETIVRERNGLGRNDILIIRQHINELLQISKIENRTIDYAKFEFWGEKATLNEIIYFLDNFLKEGGF